MILDRYRVSIRKRFRALEKRLIKTFDDDIWIVSYPKSGNTWVRFLVGNLVDPSTPITWENLESRVPDFYKHSASTLKTYSRPRLIKSHEPYHPRYRNVIYIVRDPRAVIVSYYHHLRRHSVIDDLTPISALVDRFLQGSLIQYGAWSTHVTGWMSASPRRHRLLLLRYESLSGDSEAECRRIRDFLRLDRDDGAIRACVEASSATRMRELESSPLNQQRVKTAGKRQDIPFVRSASVDSWRHELPSEAADRIRNALKDVMAKLDYG